MEDDAEHQQFVFRELPLLISHLEENGKIYFETEVGVGTEFFVEIPLMRLQDNFPDQKRVMLD